MWGENLGKKMDILKSRGGEEYQVLQGTFYNPVFYFFSFLSFYHILG